MDKERMVSQAEFVLNHFCKILKKKIKKNAKQYSDFYDFELSKKAIFETMDICFKEDFSDSVVKNITSDYDGVCKDIVVFTITDKDGVFDENELVYVLNIFTPHNDEQSAAFFWVDIFNNRRDLKISKEIIFLKGDENHV